ncbi:NADP-dependent oxidoreductase domain-containing protein [Butyriboletus roseoflavus]|nr:NADP-dependent oxidoreductase domain-containing protein [Butyriboletus roseoflavus]
MARFGRSGPGPSTCKGQQGTDSESRTLFRTFLIMSSHLIKLNNGESIPAIGLGTWQSKPNEVAHAVEAALRAGYRHLDCAWAYGNEKEVGQGLRASGVPREEVYITSKLWGTYHRRVEECLDQTLANLGTDYLDLYLVHWPVAMNPNGNHPVFPTRQNGNRDVDESRDLKDTWKDMEALVKKGEVKSIGASNFSQMMLEKILPIAEIIPAVNQLELHLYNPQLKLLDYLKSKTIVPQAYSPLGSTNSPLFTDEVATQIASKYGLNTSDVLLGYLLANDVVVLPKSVTPTRIEANFKGALAAYNKLAADDVDKLDGVAAGGKQKRLIMPAWGVDLGFDNWPIPNLNK